MEYLIEIPEKRGIGTQLADVLRAAAAGAVLSRQFLRDYASPSTRTARPWQSIATIVVATGGSESASIAVEAATDLARAFETTSRRDWLPSVR